MKNKLFRLAALFLTAAILLAGCTTGGGDTASEDAGKIEDSPILFHDMTGRQIAMDEPATRIVALTAADCEILCALGAEDALVGRGEYCDYPPSVLEVPSVQSGSETSVEQIIALEPQVVLMGTMAQSEEQISALRTSGIKVVVSDAQTIDGVYQAIEMIGMVTGQEEDAGMLVGQMKDAFAEVEQGVPEMGEKKSVYFEVSPLEWGLWTAGSGTFMNEIAEMLDLRNIFSDVSGWAEVSQEQVIERNPDYIITVTMYYGDGPRPEEEIMGREGWQDIAAVKNGNVIPANSDEITRPGPRLMDAARTLSLRIYEDYPVPGEEEEAEPDEAGGGDQPAA